MVIVMDTRATSEEVRTVTGELEQLGLQTHQIHGVERIVIGVIGDCRKINVPALEILPGVEKVVPIMKPYKLVSREAKGEDSTVQVGNVTIGGNGLVMMAGPCAVENYEQMLAAARLVKEAGASILRGGAFKPRTSPYSFQGLETEGLKLMSQVASLTGLATVSEVVDLYSLEAAVQYVDMLQIGARNMQNFRLLQAAGRSGKPVLLKRGLSATIEEWLMAAEYIMSQGNENIVLCERGIRTFEPYTRNTLDLSAVPLVKNLSHLPVVVDPSHATGDRRLVGPMARAAVAAGADGLLVEVHPEPTKALCDGQQSLAPADFAKLMQEVQAIASALGRTVYM